MESQNLMFSEGLEATLIYRQEDESMVKILESNYQTVAVTIVQNRG